MLWKRATEPMRICCTICPLPMAAQPALVFVHSKEYHGQGGKQKRAWRVQDLDGGLQHGPKLPLGEVIDVEEMVTLGRGVNPHP